MGIIAWLRRKWLDRQIRHRTQRLSEIRSGLQALRRRGPEMRAMVEPEQARVRELAKQLKKVKTRDELRRWNSLLEMCLPGLQAPLKIARTRPETQKKKRRNRK